MICISATFTAEPIQPVLEFWARQLGERWPIQFAPYNQVLQTLLDPGGLFAQNREGANVILVRPADLAQFAGATEADEDRRLEEILATAAAQRFAVPTLVAICPPRQVRVAPQPHLLVVNTDLYPVAQWADAAADRLGRIPYTPAYFTALGTAVARLLHALRRPPFKVIALDCDHTLWAGVCGEDGPTGVTIDGPRRALQEFLLRQREMGMLLALSSKNNPEDVWQTFAAHPEMVLRREHITTHRLSWGAKAQGLREMAAELSLGADSFLLLDDNPKEIAELTEGAPEVLGLTLPETGIPHYLDHVWAFDHPVVTEADRNRAASYQLQQSFAAAASLAHFYETLQLRVDIHRLHPQELPRAAQLTQRTNQFNFTTRRRSEAELAGFEAYAIHVADRFGEYGFTGLVVVVAGVVDTFLLSCRVLGRGVEHAVVRWLGEHWAALTFELIPTARNAPAQSFLHELAGQRQGTATLSAAQMRAVAFSAPAPAETATAPAPLVAADRFTGYQRLATHLDTVERIQAAMAAEQREAAPAREVASPPVTETERRLAAIWSELLGQSAISTGDNFFDLGGHSLLAVLLVTRVQEEFGMELSMDDVYSADTTLAKLAMIVETQQLRTYDPAEVAAVIGEIETLSEEEVRSEISRLCAFF
ncbi:MAG: HAD-IIIC family phosphatase [Acidobacteriaceae bacterium]|nr:HAD-IIIC family phosphatase [Acidobacteriaceae bacterium]